MLDARYGLAQGFEVYDDDLGAERASAAAVDRPAGAVTDAALAWLDGVGDGQRFFLWVHYFDPHAPYAPPEPYRGRFAGRPYDGEIAYVDAEIGRLLRHPRLAGDGRLAIFVVGDHGESLGEHHELTHGMLAYDATLHVPCIVHLPGGPAGVRSPAPVDQVDLLPTVLAAMGVEAAPAPGGGRDLLAADFLKAGAKAGPGSPTADPADPAARPLYAETYVPYYTYGWAKLRTLRAGGLKYIEAPTPELYDLADDPGETTNLAAERPQVARRMQHELERLFPPDAAGGAASSVEPDRQAHARLRALGYLGSLGGNGGSRPGGDPKELMAVHLELEEAGRRLLAGDAAAAVAGYRRALADDPGNLEALSDLATALAKSGRVEEGVRSLETALALAPDNARLHLQRGALAEEQGDAEGALKHLDRALALAPALLEARLEKAVYLARLGRHEEAAALLAETIGRYPEHAETNALYAQLVEVPRGDLGAAEARLRAAVERDPYLGDAWGALADLLASSARTGEARQVLAAALERLPGDDKLREKLDRLPAAAGAPAPAPAPAAEEALSARLRRAVEDYQRGDRAAAVAAPGSAGRRAPGLRAGVGQPELDRPRREALGRRRRRRPPRPRPRPDARPRLGEPGDGARGAGPPRRGRGGLPAGRGGRCRSLAGAPEAGAAAPARRPRGGGGGRAGGSREDRGRRARGALPARARLRGQGRPRAGAPSLPGGHPPGAGRAAGGGRRRAPARPLRWRRPGARRHLPARASGEGPQASRACG